MSKISYLAGSPYYLEDVLGLDLYERALAGNLSYLLLNQPPLCDCHCRRCFMPESRRDKCDSALGLEECCDIIRGAASSGIRCLEISGEGEPLLSQNLSGIIDCANDCGLITTLITNGHALSDEVIEFAFSRNVTLVVSLFSLNSETYEKDNDLPGSFETTIGWIKRAAKTFAKDLKSIEGKKVYRMAIHTTAQVDNYDDLAWMRAFCDEHKIFFSIAPLAPVGGGAELGKFVLTGDQAANAVSLGHNSIILSGTSKGEIGREVCGTCLYGLNVGYDGNLLFDAHAGYEVGSFLGNTRENSIEDLIATQRKFAPLMFSEIDGFCPVRASKWPVFLQSFLESPVVLDKPTVSA